jgi:hypothetical protein
VNRALGSILNFNVKRALTNLFNAGALGRIELKAALREQYKVERSLSRYGDKQVDLTIVSYALVCNFSFCNENNHQSILWFYPLCTACSL